MRHFIMKYEQGCRQASQLVSQEALHVRETIVRESGRTETAIRDHVTQTSVKLEQRFEDHITQANKERLRDRLLNSLKYPGMNERANQIEDAHTQTFHWLFTDHDNLSRRNDELYHAEPQDIDDDDASSEESLYSAFTDPSDDEHDDANRRPKMVWSSFTDWLQSSLTTYWIMGKPGSGKSTLAKFILSEPRTKMLLEKWRRDAILASHYFWRPGALMQRSVKGMLCSIIYQLVLAIPDAMKYVLVNVDRLSQKHDSTDWSAQELEWLCSGLIEHSSRPLCLLIDGLDECCPKDQHQYPLEILDSFKSDNVKIIASSRNEPVFERRFRHEPQLRMQDLTASDLYAYAAAKLRQKIWDEPFFCECLVEKAEGVFLWLVLAVQSINRGFDNGECLADLRRRMDSLPQRLNDLYKDMWERLNDDTHLYRRSAALYFRLVIAAHHSQLSCAKDGLSTMEMMLASVEDTQHAFAKSPVISASHLREACDAFRARVEVRCAGLIGLYGWPTRYRGYDLTDTEVSLGETESALLEYADKRVGFRFIHRSAQDFLVDTVEGQDILKHEAMSSKDLDLYIFNASLTTAELLSRKVGKAARRREVSAKYPPHCLGNYLGDLSIITDAGESAVRALFLRCFELYTSSVLPLYNFTETEPTQAGFFFRVAACYPNLMRYVVARPVPVEST